MQVARIITNELKVHKPCGYLAIIKDLALRNAEFQEIVAQETKLFPWAKYKTTEWCGLVKGLFCAMHGNINIEELKKNILANGFNHDLIIMREAFLKGDFLEAKNITDAYNKPTELYVGLYAALRGVYDARIEEYAKVVEPDNFALTQSYLQGFVIERRVVPLAANLMNEIKNNISAGAPKEQTQKLQEQLVQLDAYARQVRSNYSFDAQMKLADCVYQLENELGVNWRPELRRSPSMEKLFVPQTDFLVTSKEVGTISLAELKKFSGTTVEQNILHEKMVDHFVKIDSLSGQLSDSSVVQAVETYKTLIARAHELNKDSRVTLAEGVFTIGKDMVEIAVFDPPLKEIEDCLIKTAMNPADYVIKTIEGYKCVASVILDVCKNSLAGIASTPEQQVEFAEHYNQLIHNFFEGWQKLEIAQKKEFLAQIIVDTALNKVVFSLPKLMLKMGGSSTISDIVQKGESFLNRIDPGSSGGAVARAVPIAAAENVVEALEFAAGVVGSTAVAITSAGAQNVVALSEMMNGGDQANKYKLPSSLGKIIEKTPLDAPIQNDKDIIYTVEPVIQNTIKKFDVTRKIYKHAFDPDHEISKFGLSDFEAFNIFVEKILRADIANYLQEPGNQIETFINGFEGTVRIHINKGIVTSFNCFFGYSDRVIGKLIKMD